MVNVFSSVWDKKNAVLQSYFIFSVDVDVVTQSHSEAIISIATSCPNPPTIEQLFSLSKLRHCWYDRSSIGVDFPITTHLFRWSRYANFKMYGENICPDLSLHSVLYSNYILSIPRRSTYFFLLLVCRIWLYSSPWLGILLPLT